MTERRIKTAERREGPMGDAPMTVSLARHGEPKRMEPKRRWWVLLVLLLVVGLGLSVWQAMFRDSPEKALREIEVAIEGKNVSAFEHRVDVQRLSASIVDQVLATQESLPDAAGGEDLKTAIRARFTNVIKPGLAEGLAQDILTYVEAHSLGEGADPVNPRTMLQRLWFDIMGTEGTVEGARHVVTEGDKATADIAIQRPDLQSELVVPVGLEFDGSHWRVVSLPALTETLGQVEGFKQTTLMTEAETVRTELSNTIAFSEVSKAQGVQGDKNAPKTILIKASFKNAGQKSVKDFEAAITITSPQGAFTRDFSISYQGEIMPGQTMENVWPVFLDAARAEDQKIYDAKPDELTITLTPLAVNYTDGTSLSLPVVEVQ